MSMNFLMRSVKDGTHMSKYLKQGFIRKLEWKHSRGEISYSKMIELIEQECIKNIIKELTITLSNLKKTITNDESVQKQENMTAVEYLAERYNYITWLRNRDEISASTADEWREKFLKEAKEMEKKLS